MNVEYTASRFLPFGGPTSDGRRGGCGRGSWRLRFGARLAEHERASEHGFLGSDDVDTLTEWIGEFDVVVVPLEGLGVGDRGVQGERGVCFRVRGREVVESAVSLSVQPI